VPTQGHPLPQAACATPLRRVHAVRRCRRAGRSDTIPRRITLWARR
jgi:hypothetical protein